MQISFFFFCSSCSFFPSTGSAKQSKTALSALWFNRPQQTKMSFVHFWCLINYAELTPGHLRGTLEHVRISFCHSKWIKLYVNAAACCSVLACFGELMWIKTLLLTWLQMLHVLMLVHQVAGRSGASISVYPYHYQYILNTTLYACCVALGMAISVCCSTTLLGLDCHEIWYIYWLWWSLMFWPVPVNNWVDCHQIWYTHSCCSQD